MKNAKTTGRQSPDCMATTSMTIETADGAEQVNWNMGTGEITYGPNACELEGKADGPAKDENSGDGEELGQAR